MRSIVPDYATPEGIHPLGLRRAIAVAVERFSDLVPGYLDSTLVAELGLPEVAEALRVLHSPPLDADLDAFVVGEIPARMRLLLEELYLL